jgi:hypothetical protein
MNNTFNIALIKQNNIIFDYNDLINSTPDFFKSHIAKYIEIIQVTLDNVMEIIVNKIGMTTEIMGATSKCLDTNEYIYQLCHLNEDDIKGDKQQNINSIASYLVLGKGPMFGPIVLFKSDFIENRTCIPSNICNIDEVCSLLYERLVHTCVLLNSDETVTIKKFVESPSEFVTEYDINNYKFIEVNYLNFNLLIFIQMNPDNNTINKRATRLAGIYKILGSAILVCKTSENDYINITRDFYDKLDMASWGTIKSRDINDYENDADKKIGDLDVIINNFNILDNRVKKINFKDNDLVCTGCYRMRYASIIDQKNDWENHTKECLFNKPDINGYIKTKYILEQEEKISTKYKENELSDI